MNSVRITDEKTGTRTAYFVSDVSQLDELGAGYVKEVFSGEYLQTFFLPAPDGSGKLFIGTGKENLQNPQTAKELTACACKTMKEMKITSFSLDIQPFMEAVQETGTEGKEIVTACATGALLVTLQPQSYKTELKTSDYEIGILGIDKEDIVYLEEAQILAESIVFVRDLVNMPPNYLHPEDLAEKLCGFAKGTGIEARILHEGELREKGMGGLLAVGQGSDYPPCLLVLRYQGDPENSEKTGLVGKGITVDTGGYCIKPASSMQGMQGDMAGAAAVGGAICALAKKKAKVNVTAVMPICENKISGKSYVDGDVLTSYSGKTIEVLNTDAEGRLILADAVTYAVRDEKVSRVLDIATLTGAVVRMFGFTIAGVMCDCDRMWEEFSEGAGKAGEKYWRLPFGKEHEKMLESSIADIKNIGPGVCGTIVAGVFLKNFAENVPWIHVDIAGTAWVDPPVYAYQDRFATGAGVETIYYWLRK